jgi:hypothetical protein
MNTRLKNLLSRLGINMPQHYRLPENWNNRGKIKVTFIPRWRNVPVLNKLPYWVGDKICFKLEAENPADEYSSDVVYEFRNGEVVNHTSIEGKSKIVNGVTIADEGNVKMTLSVLNHYYKTDPLIITANVLNTDRWLPGCIGFFLGIIGSIISGIIVSLIIVVPAWRIWIPDWIMDFVREIVK